MEKAVENVEAAFQKAETDLNYLTRKLEFQLKNSEHNTEAENPLRLMKEIENIKTEYSALKDDIASIHEAQKEAVDVFRNQLMAMTDMLLRLESITGKSSEELPEGADAMLEEMSGLLGISKDKLLPVKPSENEESKAVGSTVAHSSSDEGNLAPVSSKKAHENVASQQKEASEPTAAEKRANSDKFIEVTHPEFMSVSDLIRGRAKLNDVNRTYCMLWEHFKEQGNAEELSPKEMNSMGLRVSGATGEAKLKILRALKLVQISKAGAVKLL